MKDTPPLGGPIFVLFMRQGELFQYVDTLGPQALSTSLPSRDIFLRRKACRTIA